MSEPKPLLTVRRGPLKFQNRPPAPGTPFAGNAARSGRQYLTIVEYRAERCLVARGVRVWRWRQTRVLAAASNQLVLRAEMPQYATVGGGTIQNRAVLWTDVRMMVMPWAWASETIAGMIAAMDAGDKSGPVLADALQDAGFPEACPVLAILRSWT